MQMSLSATTPTFGRPFNHEKEFQKAASEACLSYSTYISALRVNEELEKRAGQKKGLLPQMSNDTGSWKSSKILLNQF